MIWKPRVIIAGVIVVAAMTLNAFGIDTFTQSIGFLAAGYLFGTAKSTSK